jgi:DnaJ-class molecular chaperone
VVTSLAKRKNTPARWQSALRRAVAEGVQVRQLAGSGMWVATSANDADMAYEVTPWECECPAGQFGDPVCKHRAVLLATLGRLAAEAETHASIPRCDVCNGMGSHPAIARYGVPWRDEIVTCAHCQGTGHVQRYHAA